MPYMVTWFCCVMLCRSFHLVIFWILFENVMSLHRTKATFIGLLEAGRVNEWIVTEKLGHVLQTKLGSKVPKKPRFRMGDRCISSSHKNYTLGNTKEKRIIYNFHILSARTQKSSTIRMNCLAIKWMKDWWSISSFFPFSFSMQHSFLFKMRHGFKFYIVVKFADYIFWSSLLGFTYSFVGVMMWLLERATSLYTFFFNQRHFSQQDSGTLAPLSLVLTKTLAASERIFWIVQRDTSVPFYYYYFSASEIK